MDNLVDLSSPKENTYCLEYVLFAEMEKKTETNFSVVGNNPNHKVRISGH